MSLLLQSRLKLAPTVFAGVLALHPIVARAVEIVGASSCGQWVADRSTDRDEYVTTWLVGYLSGKAVATGKNFLKNTDNKSVYLWMDNYCRSNPLRHISDGADDLAIELIRMKKL